MITEDQFRQALSAIRAGLSNPSFSIVQHVLIVALYFMQTFSFPTGVAQAIGVESFGGRIGCGVEFRALCEELGVDCSEGLEAAPIDEGVSLASGGLGAIVSVALAKKLLAALAEKATDPRVKAAIQALLVLIG